MSKYDVFWIRIQSELEAAIKKSLQTGSEITLKLSELTEQGNRATWSAKGIIGADNPDNMAHGTALANCLTAFANENGLQVEYAVAKDGREIRLIATKHTESSPPNQITPPRSAQTKPATNCKMSVPAQITKIVISPSSKQQQQVIGNRTMKKLEGKTLLILPCCIDKKGRWPYPTPAPAVPNAFTQARNLIRGDRPPRKVLLSPRTGIDPTPALWFYSGDLYAPLGNKSVLHTAMEDWLDIVILSGGYGITHAYEPIVPYEAPMPKFFNEWIEADLPNALKTYIELTKPNNVIAFFSNNANKKKSYGDIYCRGAGDVKVSGILGKYVANKVDIKKFGSGKANTSLGNLVMEVVNTKTLTETDDIPFYLPCWFPPS